MKHIALMIISILFLLGCKPDSKEEDMYLVNLYVNSPVFFKIHERGVCLMTIRDETGSLSRIHVMVVACSPLVENALINPLPKLDTTCHENK